MGNGALPNGPSYRAHPRLYPRRVQIVLALEIETACWPTNCTAGDTQAHPRDEHCQSAMGSAADPRRVAQARHRRRTDERGQVYGQKTRPTVARLEDVPTMLTASRRWICSSCRRSRFVCYTAY